MIIAIIGSGNVGGALAQRFFQNGHTVLIGARYPLSAKGIKLATVIGEDCFTTVESAAKQAEVILLTTPPEAVPALLPKLGDVSQKVIIDTTNSIRTRPEPYPNVLQAVKALTNTDKVVKCFNTTGFENMLNPSYDGQPIDMFVAGSSEEAKTVATRLAKEIGFGACYDFGGDDKVELIEKFAFSWINLAIMQGNGRDMAFKVVKR